MFTGSRAATAYNPFMRPAVVAVSLLLASFPSIAQQPSGTQPELPPEAPRMAIEVRLIEVEAVVTDRSGNPVTGLTADDFELFENGRRRTITNLSEYHTAAPQDPSAPVSTPLAPAAAAAKAPPRTIVIVIEPMPQSRNRELLYQQLRSLISRTVRDGDRVQLLAWRDNGGMKPATPLTTDRTLVDRALDASAKGVEARAGGTSLNEFATLFEERDAAIAGKTAGGSFSRTPAQSGSDPSGGTASGEIDTTIRQLAEADLAVMRRKTAALQRVIATLGRPEGRNALIYVARAFPLVAGRAALGQRFASQPSDGGYSTEAFLRGVVESANANGVAFYGLYPPLPESNGIGTVEDDSVMVQHGTEMMTDVAASQLAIQNDVAGLTSVANATGGSVAVGPAAIAKSIDTISRDLSSYYSLAYRTESDGRDRERRIEVRAKNRDYRVRTRRTLVEKSDRTRARDLVVAKLFEAGTAGGIDFDVKTGKPQIDLSKAISLPVELAIPVEQLKFDEDGSGNAAHVRILAVTASEEGEVSEVYEDARRVAATAGTAPAGDLAYTFTLRYDNRPRTLSIAVVDEATGVSGTRQLKLGGTNITEIPQLDPMADPAWAEALRRADAERKPVLVLFTTRRCFTCNAIEREWSSHPSVVRRMAGIIFTAQPVAGGTATKLWHSQQAGLAVVDRTGAVRARWTELPKDLTAFATLVDAVAAAAPHFERAARLAASKPHDSALALAGALNILGKTHEAIALVDQVMATADPTTAQYASITRAILDAREGRRKEALEALDRTIASAATVDIAATAWLVTGSVQAALENRQAAAAAWRTAADLAEKDSELARQASALLGTVQGGANAAAVMQIVRFSAPVVSGRNLVRTTVTSPEVARVVFTLDGGQPQTVSSPPFAAAFDFGALPQAHALHAVAFDRAGHELASDDYAVNTAGETFWTRITSPEPGSPGGDVEVEIALRTPAGHALKRVAISWNDAERASLVGPPWHAKVSIPANETGVLRAVALLDDGRTAEDTVLLGGYSERADVQLVELPIMVTKGDAGSITSAVITVREGRANRVVESLAGAAEAPLTVGLVFDTSSSMYKRLPDVQEAALRFIESVVGSRDRAFVVGFDDAARLVQPPTSDRVLLQRQLTSLHAGGRTALFDALVLGLLQFEGVKGRKALVVFSDGADTSSHYKSIEVEELARRSNIPIFVISTTPDLPEDLALPSAGPVRGTLRGSQPQLAVPSRRAAAAQAWGNAIGAMRRIAGTTGGDVHIIRKLDELPAIYAAIAETLKNQLIATIRTDASATQSEWRKVRVEVDAKGVDVRTPEGYTVTW